MFRTDNDIQNDVVAELKWEPSLRDDDVAVAVRDGVVTLAGFVDSYSEKWKAEQVASKVKGVRAIANDIQVKLPVGSERPDPDVARAAADALRWTVTVPADRIKVRVAQGWLTLEGTVDWYYQKEAAERAVRHLTGVRGVSNLITVAVRPSPSDVKTKIKESLERAAQFDADHITVEVEGHKAVLRGTVRSYAELKDAERAALNAPGITQVENKLTISVGAYATA